MVGRCISYWNSPFLGDMLVFQGVSPGSVPGSHAMAWETLRLYLPPVESRHLGGHETCHNEDLVTVSSWGYKGLTTWPLFGGAVQVLVKDSSSPILFAKMAIMLNFTKSRQTGCTWRCFFLPLRFYSQLYSLLRPATFRLKRVGTWGVCPLVLSTSVYEIFVEFECRKKDRLWYWGS